MCFKSVREEEREGVRDVCDSPRLWVRGSEAEDEAGRGGKGEDTLLVARSCGARLG